jgi:histidine ammonia-lyase
VCAALLLACCQAVEIRQRKGELPGEAPHAELARLHEGVRRQATFVEADRALEPELRALLEVIRGRKLL